MDEKGLKGALMIAHRWCLSKATGVPRTFPLFASSVSPKGTPMNLIPERYYWLAGSLVTALILDGVVARALLELFRPTSAYVFRIGRAGKIAALFAWLAFFDSYWYPQFLGAGEGPSPMIRALEVSTIGIALLLAFVTVPRIGSAERARSDV